MIGSEFGVRSGAICYGKGSRSSLLETVPETVPETIPETVSNPEGCRLQEWFRVPKVVLDSTTSTAAVVQSTLLAVARFRDCIETVLPHPTFSLLSLPSKADLGSRCEGIACASSFCSWDTSRRVATRAVPRSCCEVYTRRLRRVGWSVQHSKVDLPARALHTFIAFHIKKYINRKN